MSILKQIVAAITNHDPDSLGADFISGVVDRAKEKGIRLEAGLHSFRLKGTCGCAMACISVAIADEKGLSVEVDSHSFCVLLFHETQASRVFKVGDAFLNLYSIRDAISDGFEYGPYVGIRSRHSEDWHAWQRLGCRFRNRIPYTKPKEQT